MMVKLKAVQFAAVEVALKSGTFSAWAATAKA